MRGIWLKIDTNQQVLQDSQAVEDLAWDNIGWLNDVVVREHLLDLETRVDVRAPVEGQTVLTESSARLADLLNDGWDNSVGEDWREDDEVGQLIHDTLSTGQLVQSVSTFVIEEDLMNIFEIL